MPAYRNATYVQAQVTATLLKMMETDSYQTISISELAYAANVSRSSFYRNFTDKDDVLRRHMQALLDAWKKDFGAVPGQDFSASLLRHFYENRDFYLLLYRSGLAWMLHENIKNACKVNADAPPVFAYAAAAVAGALFGWIDEWISRGMVETPEELERLAAEVEQEKACETFGC